MPWNFLNARAPFLCLSRGLETDFVVWHLSEAYILSVTELERFKKMYKSDHKTPDCDVY